MKGISIVMAVVGGLGGAMAAAIGGYLASEGATVAGLLLVLIGLGSIALGVLSLRN